jgi:hypothetical protein
MNNICLQISTFLWSKHFPVTLWCWKVVLTWTVNTKSQKSALLCELSHIWFPSNNCGEHRYINSQCPKNHQADMMEGNMDTEGFYIQWNLYSLFSSGVWKRNNGSRKTNYPGTIDRGFTVLCHLGVGYHCTLGAPNFYSFPHSSCIIILLPQWHAVLYFTLLP